MAVTDMEGRIISAIVNAEQEAQEADIAVRRARKNKKPTTALERKKLVAASRVEGMWSIVNMLMPQGTPAREELYQHLGWE